MLIFSPEAKLLDAWGRGIIARKHELRIYNNKVYICDITMQQVYEFTFDGELLRAFGKRGKAGPGKDEFNWPTDVAVAPNGDFYITDGYGNSRVVCLSPEGKFQFSFGTKGAEPGQFERPHGIVIDKNERLLVADRKNNRIQIFDMNGKFLDQWTNVGKPFGLFLTPDNLLYVADGNFDGPHRILILDLEGNILSQFGSKGTKPGQFDTPHSLTVDPEGKPLRGRVRKPTSPKNSSHRTLDLKQTKNRLQKKSSLFLGDPESRNREIGIFLRVKSQHFKNWSTPTSPNLTSLEH